MKSLNEFLTEANIEKTIKDIFYKIRNDKDHWSAERGDERELNLALRNLKNPNSLDKFVGDGKAGLMVLLRRRGRITNDKTIRAYVDYVHKNIKSFK